MPTTVIESVLYPVPLGPALDAVTRALAGLGMAVTAANPAAGTIQARSSMSMATWGENIHALLRPAGDAGTQIDVTSSLKFGLVDWGRNRANVNRIHEGIAATLAQTATSGGPRPAAWHPDPYGRHEHRWWDGLQWTGSVSDGGVVASDPQG